MTIDEIYKKEQISVRSYHICKYNELNSISDLKKYYYKNQSFEKLQNCGRRSNEELIDICNKYSDENAENKDFEVKKENPLKDIISDLTRVQREVLNNFISENTNNLTVRSRNGICQFLNGNFKIKNFANRIFLSDSFDVSEIKNIGLKSSRELENYFNIIKEIIYQVYAVTEEKELTKLRNKFLMEKKFEEIQIPDDILEIESLFKIIDYLLYQNVLFDKTQTIIIKNALKVYYNQNEKSLEEISNIVNLSRERVRQIKKVCLSDLFNNLLFISNFNDDLFQKYSIEVESKFIDINSDVVELINNTNGTNFSREFIIYILAAYLNDIFSIVGNYEDVLQPKYFKSLNRHNWNNFYLVEKGLALEFDFTSFINDISNRKNARIEESYSFNFKSYLSNFLTNNKIDFLDLLFPICEKIINEEFEIYLDLDDNILFKRNTTKQVYEYAYVALEQLGKPSKVKLIFNKVKELHPHYDTSESGIRASMKRKNGFVPIGRKSVFGLKKWESELDNFKGGTIKDVIIDFLKTQKEPTHISKVLEYLEKFRQKKDERSVITNLKVDPMKRFLIFNQGFIGLQEYKNEYNDKFKKLPVQLGKTIIGKHKKGYSINYIQTFLLKSLNLTFEESKLILDNLKYFNENKRN
jgi:hypothetical protein